MKIRQSFISNSSSSSFIVENYQKQWNGSKFVDIFLLTDQQKQILKDYGFEGVHSISALNALLVTPTPTDLPPVFHFDVSCNEDEVIAFLLSNKIPFTAACHYGDYSIIYRGGDTFREIYNLGKIEVSMINEPPELRDIYFRDLYPYTPKEHNVTEWLESNT